MSERTERQGDKDGQRTQRHSRQGPPEPRGGRNQRGDTGAHMCLRRCQLGHPSLLLLSDEFGMVAAVNLPKTACQLSCGCVCVPGSAPRASWASKQQRGPAQDLTLSGNAARTQTLCEGCAAPLAGT